VADEPALDRLYQVPPRDFVRTRKALAAELRGAKRPEAAAALAALRRPTVPVWVVNQLARRRAPDVEALVEAAERARAAQLGRRGDVAEALRAFQRALAALTGDAEPIAREAGARPTPGLLGRVAATLRAAAVTPGLAARLRLGRLDREPAAPGFDVFAGERPRATVVPFRPRPPATPAPAPRAPARAARGDVAARARERTRRVLAAREALRGADRAARARARAADALARRAAAAQAQAEAAERQAADARRRAEDAARAAAEAREAATRAADARREAASALEAARGDPET
jgi:hypothetical protein